MKPTYIQALGTGYPEIQVSCQGDGSVYDDLVAENPQLLPSKEELDAWIILRVKENLWDKIQEERERRKFDGVYVEGYWFHNDNSSRIQWLGLVLLGQNMPPNIPWKTMNKVFKTMTPELATNVFVSIALTDLAIFAAAEAHKAAMESSDDPSSYEYMTPSTWPTVYSDILS